MCRQTVLSPKQVIETMVGVRFWFNRQTDAQPVQAWGTDLNEQGRDGFASGGQIFQPSANDFCAWKAIEISS